MPLQKCRYAFMNAEQREAWKRISATSSLRAAKEALEAQAASAPNTRMEWADISKMVMGAISPIEDEKKAFIAAREADVRAWLSRKQLLAFGFETERRLNDVPVSVPDEMWSGKIDWFAGKVTHNSLTFIEVRLIPTAQLEGTLLDDLEAAPQKRGRPTVAQFVETAIKDLADHGKIDTNASQAAHYDIIREHVVTVAQREGTEIQRLSNETIRQYFSPVFKDLKKTKKQ